MKFATTALSATSTRALEAFKGECHMPGTTMVEHFAPLMDWHKEAERRSGGRLVKIVCLGALAALAVLIALPASAQEAEPPSISASKPEVLHKVLREAGYDAELIADREPGDGAAIRLDSEGGGSFILLSDCDEAVPDACDTLVLSSAWDRDTPMSPQRVAAANREFRYVSVWLDDEGDPYAQWAIVTRLEGIPAPVFLNTLQRYLGVVDDLSDFVFADDEEADGRNEE